MLSKVTSGHYDLSITSETLQCILVKLEQRCIEGMSNIAAARLIESLSIVASGGLRVPVSDLLRFTVKYYETKKHPRVLL